MHVDNQGNVTVCSPYLALFEVGVRRAVISYKTSESIAEVLPSMSGLLPLCPQARSDIDILIHHLLNAGGAQVLHMVQSQISPTKLRLNAKEKLHDEESCTVRRQSKASLKVISRWIYLSMEGSDGTLQLRQLAAIPLMVGRLHPHLSLWMSNPVILCTTVGTVY